jgi:hypothetical protein
MQSGHWGRRWAYVRSILIAVALAIALGWVFEHVVESDEPQTRPASVLKELESIQADGLAALEALEPLALSKAYARELGRPVFCWAMRGDFRTCFGQITESPVRVCPALPEDRFSFGDVYAWLCMQIQREPAGGRILPRVPPGLWILLYPSTSMVAAIGDALPEKSAAAIFFVGLELLIGASLSLMGLVDAQPLDWRVNLLLFPIGAIVAASLFALPLQLLMVIAVRVSWGITSLAGIACQVAVYGVTLWKVVEYTIHAIAHHAIDKRIGHVHAGDGRPDHGRGPEGDAVDRLAAAVSPGSSNDHSGEQLDLFDGRIQPVRPSRPRSSANPGSREAE